MSDRPSEYEMTALLNFLSEYSTTLRTFQVLEEMTSELGDEAETLRAVEHWLEWRRGK